MTELVMSYFRAEDGECYGFDQEQIEIGLSAGMKKLTQAEVKALMNPADRSANSERAWRDGELNGTDGLVARHRDQVESGGATTLNADEYKQLQSYRISLRDWPEATSFPKATMRPSAPGWLITKSIDN